MITDQIHYRNNNVKNKNNVLFCCFAPLKVWDICVCVCVGGALTFLLSPSHLPTPQFYGCRKIAGSPPFCRKFAGTHYCRNFDWIGTLCRNFDVLPSWRDGRSADDRAYFASLAAFGLGLLPDICAFGQYVKSALPYTHWSFFEKGRLRGTNILHKSGRWEKVAWGSTCSSFRKCCTLCF